MADALLSALVTAILDNLKSLSMEKIGLAGAFKKEFENLESTLTTIQAVLQDAEVRQCKSEAIRNWLGKLKDTAYSVEEVLDEFKTEALRRSLLKDAISQVSTFFSLQNPLLFRLNMARKFKTVREKLDAIAGEKNKFHLREGLGEVEIQRREERQTSSLVIESEVYGRANEKEQIVSLLLNNLSHHDDLSVYAICGMGGLGKTTIAQLVYNDENVRKAFDLRVWVCVSDDFDIKRLTKAIVESIEGNSCNIQELDPLQRRLEEKLVGKRFLLVLDDVWNEYHDKWDGLKQALRRGVKGSTVIVTTRIEKVALMMATVNPVCRLGCLSDDDSWSLFKERAFGMGRNEDNVHLETIGRQIVKKCGGVPLALKAIGSIMHLKSQESEWLNVRDSEIWDLEDEGSRILAVLRLSYEHLPPYLRQCFSFCSIFPKDHVMSKQELIELWMANGFIPSRGPMDLHEMGCEIFDELSWRSFFQETKEDIYGNVMCKMHDLIHDVATSIMRHECCVIEPNEMLKIPKTARHLFVYSSSSSTIVEVPKLQPLRSLILRTEFRSGIKLSNQKYLKVLDLWGHFEDIVDDYLLKHLRYLNLSWYGIEILPESTSGLYNLQTLKIRHCHRLRMLPKGMKNLKNLRYLYITGCDQLTCMPVGLSNLSCLRKLDIFIVGMDKGLGIDELKELALEGELSIKALYNVKSSAEAKSANLIKKPNLRSLSLSWQANDKENSQHENAEEILNGLQPHSSLKKLCITDYQGLRFPYWMMDLLLPNLVEISLQKCERCDQLPPLGKLRFLKELRICGMDALKSIDSNFYGDGESSFPSLEKLEICHAQCLEEWATINGRDNFPLLSSLRISYCPKLVKLQMVQSVKHLDIEETSVTLLRSVIMNATCLTSLRIGFFHELTDLPDGLLQNQKHLDRLWISSSNLKSLSNQLDNLSALKHLQLDCGSKLESLPAGLQSLSSLETLRLNQCDSLVALSVNGLHGLSSLSSLWVQNCKKLASLSGGMRYLISLQDMHISVCPELTSLPESIQHLSSLRSLRIWYCEGLISLPNEIQHLALLSELEIGYCSNLMSLPQGMRSLTALKTLRIEGCPHLEKRCKQERGEDWPNIAHIPSIVIESGEEITSSRNRDWTCGLSRKF
ncbi:putative disease resistance protein RGA1 [Durio zibethinus]|uniref:Disease resistance protein RGA1 n=1 Tax=Durio zibethinus TaxID=66656 RepID=A0A6P6B494_DURZI|nr:putative disease resistance protein RGA1 [Durio zibethinus]